MIVAVRRLVLAVLVLLAPALAAAQTYTISPPPFLLAQNNSGTIINNACIWTYAAGTTTPATTYTTSTGVANTNPIRSDSAGRFTAYLSPGTSYKFVYESACTPPAHGTVLKTADNVSGTPTSAATVDVPSAMAGEAIAAGQCAYLSDGSGGKSASQWYKCDSANTYSSTTNWIGLAPSAIASGTTGIIRRAGVVTGLTVNAGSVYYVGSSGAITTTAPTNARKIGQADSATSLVVGDPTPFTGGTLGQVVTAQGSGVPPTFQAQGFFDDFRLSLTTATCITTADVTAATTVFFTPCAGNRITLFDTSGNQETCTTAEISIAVPATTSQLYDVWVKDSTFGTCAVALELLAWTNDTTRATAIARANGRWTKSGDTSRMYVGSFRTTTVSGQTEDSVTKRYVWNYYNRAERHMVRIETTNSYTYATNTIRQANASTANQVNFIVGVQESLSLTGTLIVAAQGAAGGNQYQSGLVLDSTTTFDTSMPGGMFSPNAAIGDVVAAVSTIRKYPAVGFHFLSWNENSPAAATVTVFSNNSGSHQQSGFTASIWG